MFIVFQIFFATRAVLKIGEYINSRHLVQKCPRTLSVPRTEQFSKSDNCEVRGTDNVQGQISEHIFAPNGGYCLYPSSVFRNAHSFETW